MEEATVVQTISATPSDALQGEAWTEAQWLPCQLQVELIISAFTIGDLLRLDVGAIVDTLWKQNADVPLRVNGLVIANAEFEVIGDKSAVRVTELI